MQCTSTKSCTVIYDSHNTIQYIVEWDLAKSKSSCVWQLWRQLQRVAVLLEHKLDVRNTSKWHQKYRIAIIGLHEGVWRRLPGQIQHSLVKCLQLDDIPASIGQDRTGDVALHCVHHADFSLQPFWPQRGGGIDTESWNFHHSVGQFFLCTACTTLPKQKKTHFWMDIYPRLFTRLKWRHLAFCGIVCDPVCTLGSQKHGKERQYWFGEKLWGSRELTPFRNRQRECSHLCWILLMGKNKHHRLMTTFTVTNFTGILQQIHHTQSVGSSNYLVTTLTGLQFRVCPSFIKNCFAPIAKN